MTNVGSFPKGGHLRQNFGRQVGVEPKALSDLANKVAQGRVGSVQEVMEVCSQQWNWVAATAGPVERRSVFIWIIYG